MLEPYYNISKATGVSVNISQNGDAEICICGVTVNNNQLDIEKRVIDLKSVEQLVKHLPKKSYLALNISGRGVLHKHVEKIEDVNNNNFIQILPNAKFDDFYIQNFISGDKSFISIIRKEEADKWIDVLAQLEFIICTLSLGPFPVQNILPQLNVYDSDFVFNGHVVQRDDKRAWLAYRYDKDVQSPFGLKIESEPIDEKLIIAYANAFQLVLENKLKSIRADVPVLDLVYQKVMAEKKIQVTGFIILSAFFILLLINFIVLSYLNTSNIKLTNQVSQSAQSINDIQGIGDKVKGKEALLKNLGWDNGINKSKLIDQIAGLLPEGVTMNALTVNPIDQADSRMQKSLKFIDREIRVVGSSQKIIPVNEWVARIKTQKWAKNVQLESYLYNSELNTGQFVITIDF